MTSHKTSNKTREIERLGKFFAFVYESNFVSYRRMLWLSFIRGVFQGIGGFIGATIGISILIWIASLFVGAPVLGPLIEWLQGVSAR